MSTGAITPTQGLMFHGRAPGDRDDGAEVMRVWRAVSLTAAGMRPRLPPVEYAVLLAVHGLVVSWTRLWDEVYVADVAIVAGLVTADGTGDAKECGRRLRSLAARGLISYEPSRVKGRPSRIGLGTGLPAAAAGESVRGGRTAPPKRRPATTSTDSVRGGQATPPKQRNRGGHTTPLYTGGVREEEPPPSDDATTGTQTALLVPVPGGGGPTPTTTTTATTATPAGTAGDEQGADMRTVLDAIAAGLPLPDRDRALLAGPVRDALAAGWEPMALGAHLVDRVGVITTTTAALMRHRLRLGDDRKPRVLPESPAVCPCAPCGRHTATVEAEIRRESERLARARDVERHQAVVDADADAAARHDAIDAEIGPVLHGRIVAAALVANPRLKTRQLSPVRVRHIAADTYRQHGHDVAAIRAYAEGLPPGPQETATVTGPDGLPLPTATQTARSATQSATPTPTYQDGVGVPSLAELEAAIAERLGGVA